MIINTNKLIFNDYKLYGGINKDKLFNGQIVITLETINPINVNEIMKLFNNDNSNRNRRWLPSQPLEAQMWQPHRLPISHLY